MAMFPCRYSLQCRNRLLARIVQDDVQPYPNLYFSLLLTWQSAPTEPTVDTEQFNPEMEGSGGGGAEGDGGRGREVETERRREGEREGVRDGGRERGKTERGRRRGRLMNTMSHRFSFL